MAFFSIHIDCYQRRIIFRLYNPISIFTTPSWCYL